uniref:V-set and immunoglobulin domain-containing protein 1 n=1 Tax=Stegastes partitus TaxID=144197 RepID=A0A3B4ZTG4_9TELE
FAMLQCSFVSTEAATTSLTIQWDVVTSSSMTPQQVEMGRNSGRVTAPSAPATTKNASIVINNMQPSDAGVYTCEVHNFPDVEGQSQANIIVNVLEKPSTPYCSVHGDVETGHLVTLTCHSESGSPNPTYTWTRLDQTKTRRPVLGRSESLTTTGILEIKNMSQFEFGEYQCNATNTVGFSTCTIELSPVGDGVIAGAVIGALLGCVLIVLVVWFIAHSVKKHKYRAVKAAEANEMNGNLSFMGATSTLCLSTRRSRPQAQEAADSVPMATTASSHHAEVCWKRETSKTCRTVALKDQDWTPLP